MQDSHWHHCETPDFPTIAYCASEPSLRKLRPTSRNYSASVSLACASVHGDAKTRVHVLAIWTAADMGIVRRKVPVRHDGGWSGIRARHLLSVNYLHWGPESSTRLTSSGMNSAPTQKHCGGSAFFIFQLNYQRCSIS